MSGISAPPPSSPSVAAPDAGNRAPFFDPVQFFALSKLYWRLATRGSVVPALRRGNRKFGIFPSLIFIVAFGFILLAPALKSKITLFEFALYAQTATLFISGMVAVLESSSIIFSPLEEDLLNHRPIAPYTLIIAKMANLLVVAGGMAVLFNVCAAMGMAGIARGQGIIFPPVVHLLSILWLSFFCVGGVTCFYRFALQAFGAQRVRTAVTYAQIVLVIIFMLASQLLPRVVSNMGPASFTIIPAPWMLLYPGAWVAALEDILLSGRFFEQPNLNLCLAALGLLGPPLMMFVGAQQLGAAQQGITAGMMEKPSAVQRGASPAGAERSISPLIRWWLRDPVERAAFRLAATYMRRDSWTMQQLYPQFAYAIIYPFLLGFGARHLGSFAFLTAGAWMVSSLVFAAITTLGQSEQCAAAEIFAVTPLDHPGALFQGVRKAAFFYLTIPAGTLVLVVSFFLSHAWLHDLGIAAPAFLMIPAMSMLQVMGKDVWLPLSQPPRQGRQAMRGMEAILALLLMAAACGIGYLASKYGFLWAVYVIEIPAVWFICKMAARHLDRPRAMRIES